MIDQKLLQAISCAKDNLPRMAESASESLKQAEMIHAKATDFTVSWGACELMSRKLLEHPEKKGKPIRDALRRVYENFMQGKPPNTFVDGVMERVLAILSAKYQTHPVYAAAKKRRRGDGAEVMSDSVADNAQVLTGALPCEALSSMNPHNDKGMRALI